MLEQVKEIKDIVSKYLEQVGGKILVSNGDCKVKELLIEELSTLIYAKATELYAEQTEAYIKDLENNKEQNDKLAKQYDRILDQNKELNGHVKDISEILKKLVTYTALRK
jgi:hypothetical protein